MSKPGSARAQLLARIKELESAGVDGLPGRVRSGLRARPPTPAMRPARRASATVAPAATRAAGGAGRAAVPAPAVAAPPSLTRMFDAAGGPEWRGLDLGSLGSFLGDCERCKLCQGRTQVVFGVGNPNARLMFIGEAPGRDEDEQGVPFVGRAGQLLTDMIEKGLGIARADVYIANVVKCRPPENRNPELDEIAACSPFLRRQVELVGPEVLVGLGRFAVQTLLETTLTIGALRGKWHDYGGTPLMPTFHPAYLLRSPGEKRATWEDLKQVKARLGLS